MSYTAVAFAWLMSGTYFNSVLSSLIIDVSEVAVRTERWRVRGDGSSRQATAQQGSTPMHAPDETGDGRGLTTILYSLIIYLFIYLFACCFTFFLGGGGGGGGGRRGGGRRNCCA